MLAMEPNPGVWKYEPIPTASGVAGPNGPDRKYEPGRVRKGVGSGTGSRFGGMACVVQAISPPRGGGAAVGSWMYWK